MGSGWGNDDNNNNSWDANIPSPPPGDGSSNSDPYGAPSAPNFSSGGSYQQYGNGGGSVPPSGGYGGQPEHPQGTTILILGILGLVCCFIPGLIAAIMGFSARKEIEAGQYAKTVTVEIGFWLGVASIVLGCCGSVAWLMLSLAGSA